MHKRLITRASLLLAIVITAMSCQQQESAQKKAAPSADTTQSQSIKPNETGYADVNGLKMYYEVYGKGEPIVLLHGSYMTIPLNWSGFIPLLAKNRKVIVAEMQGPSRV